MAKLRKVQSASKPEDTKAEQPVKENVDVSKALNMIDGYLDSLESSNENIVNALEQLATRELTDAERADLSKMVNLDLKYTVRMSKKIKRIN